MPSGIYPINWGTFNIRPVGDPGDPFQDDARTLSAIMATQARAARGIGRGGGGGGGKEKPTSGKMLLNINGKPQWVDVPGSTGQERMQNAKMMQKAYDDALVQQRTATLTESLGDWGNMSNKRKADTLARVKADVLPGLTQGLDEKQAKTLTAALVPYAKSQQEELRAIESDKGFGSQFLRRGWDAAANAVDAARAYVNDVFGDTQDADAARRNIAERARAASQEPYMREMRRREAEGEDWLSRQGGSTGDWRSSLGAVIGEFAPEGLAGVAAAAATAATGGIGGGVVAPILVGSATGASVNALADLGGTTTRIMADESIPMEQRLQGARSAAGDAFWAGAGIGAIPAVGTSLIRPVQRLNAVRRVGSKATQEIKDAAVQQAQTRAWKNLGIDAGVNTLEQAGLNVADLGLQNTLYGEAVGKDVDTFDGWGAALAAAVPFGVLGGYAHYRGRPSAPVDARAKLGFETPSSAETDASWTGAANAFAQKFDSSFTKVNVDDMAAGLTPDLLHPQVQRVMFAERYARPDLDPSYTFSELDFMRMVVDQAGEGSFWKTEQGKKTFDAYAKYIDDHPEVVNAGRPKDATGTEGAGTNGAEPRATADTGQAESGPAGPNVASNPPGSNRVDSPAAKGGSSPDAASTPGSDGNTGGDSGARVGEQSVPGAGQAEGGTVDAQTPGTPAGEQGADGGRSAGAESATPETGAGERSAVGTGVGRAGDAQRSTADVYNTELKQKTPYAIFKALNKQFKDMGLTDPSKLHNTMKLQDAMGVVETAYNNVRKKSGGDKAGRSLTGLHRKLNDQLKNVAAIEAAYYKTREPSPEGVKFTPEETKLFDHYAKDPDAIRAYLDELRTVGHPELDAMANWFQESPDSPWSSKLASDTQATTEARSEGLGVEPSATPKDTETAVGNDQPVC